MGMLIQSYIIKQVIPNVCTKFQNTRCSSSWECFGEKEKWPNKENEKHEDADSVLHDTSSRT